MGAFILGILVGWLLEWLFFNFWIKGRSTGPFAGITDASNLKSELAAKETEIASLKLKLEESSSNTQSAASTPVSTESKQGSTSNKSVSSTSNAKTATATTSKASSATDKKTTTKAKKPAAKKAPAKKSASKPKAATKAAAKKPAGKTKASTKTAAKKPASKTKANTKTVAKKPANKAKSSINTKGDDLTKLSGIGPSMAATLNELGIDSYTKLSQMDDDILRDMLEASGARLNNNKEAMDSWNEQADLAAKGDFAGLKKLQDALKK